MWHYSSSISWLICYLMKGEGDPANSALSPSVLPLNWPKAWATQPRLWGPWGNKLCVYDSADTCFKFLWSHISTENRCLQMYWVHCWVIDWLCLGILFWLSSGIISDVTSIAWLCLYNLQNIDHNSIYMLFKSVHCSIHSHYVLSSIIFLALICVCCNKRQLILKCAASDHI